MAQPSSNGAGNNLIREVVLATGNIITVAGNGTSGYSGDGATATSAQVGAKAGMKAANEAIRTLIRGAAEQTGPGLGVTVDPVALAQQMPRLLAPGCGLDQLMLLAKPAAGLRRACSQGHFDEVGHTGLSKAVGVPQSDRAVVAGAGEQPTIRAQGDAVNRAGVPFEDRQALPAFGAP